MRGRTHSSGMCCILFGTQSSYFGNESLCSISNELNIEPYEGFVFFFFLSETPGAIHFISCALFLSGHGEHRSGPQTKET